MIQPIDPQLIDPNPFQPASRLSFTPDDIADLSSIGDPGIGLIKIPVVRPHPTQRGRYQRCDGHRRQAAWILYHPGQPMPNDVQDLTDRQLYEHMAIENGQRQDLSPIEKAQIVKGHIERFGTTQAAAGELVGLRTQGAVSNLLKLLSLPTDVQPLVNPRQVPQRIARQLVRPGQLAPKDTTRIAQAIAAAADDDKEDVAEDELRSLAQQIGTHITWKSFKIDWDPGQIEIDGKIQSPGPCTACDYYLHIGYADYCTLHACHAAKRALFPRYELQRVSNKFGIPIAAEAETVHTLNINYSNESKVKAILSAKKRPEHLRLIPSPPNYHIDHMSRLLESDFVWLASTDKHALDGKPKAADQPTANERAAETPAQRAKRIAAEQREADQRRAERSAARRARADVTWLMQQLTLDTAAQLKIEGGVLAIAAHDISRGTGVSSDWPELLPFERLLRDKDASVLRQHIIFKLLLADIQTYRPAETFSWTRALQKAHNVVEKDLKLKLRTGWDQPPIHHTESNCWICGVFTPGSTITRVDRAAGWQIAKDGTVTCSDDCRASLAKTPAKASRGTKSKGTRHA